MCVFMCKFVLILRFVLILLVLGFRPYLCLFLKLCLCGFLGTVLANVFMIVEFFFFFLFELCLLPFGIVLMNVLLFVFIFTDIVFEI